MKKHSFAKSGICCKLVSFLLVFLVLATLFGVSASAEDLQRETYDTYTYWTAPGTSWAVSSTPMYEYERTITAQDLGLSEFDNPSDIVTDNKGRIYVMDTENGRIVVVNPDYTLNTVIQNIPYKDDVLDIKGAKGIFVTEKQEIYIADTLNQRVIITNLKMQVLDILELPEEDVIPENFSYAPVKITVDSDGFVYVLSDGSYYGAVLYKPDGSFSGFFGATSVQTSILGVFQRIYDLIFVSETKKENAEKTLPYCFTDITIDNKDFVYTATGATDSLTSNLGQLRKLSPGGTNVLKDKTKSEVGSTESKNFTDGKPVKFPGVNGTSYEWRNTNMATMDVDKYGYMYGFCTKFGHVFIYDQECNLLTVFGAALNDGVQKGTFAAATSIQVNDVTQDVLIVDPGNRSFTVYKETEYGALVKKAQDLTTAGSYEEAKPYWEKALTYDRNSQLAYRGLARAALITEEYEQTLEYAKLGFDQSTYSSAFTYVRNEYLTNNFLWLFGLAVLLIVGVIVFLVYLKKHNIKLIKNKKVITMFECLVHPFQGAQQIRYYDNGSTKLATLMLFLFFISTIISEIYSGFMYNLFDKASYNAIFTILKTVGIVALWSICNWAMSTLFQGKGKIKHIYVVTCYALLPLIANNILHAVLTNILTPEEVLVINVINVICIALAAIIITVGTMTSHEYGFFKFLVMTLVVIFAMLVAVFCILMVFVLIQQMTNFISSIYKEVTYR